jgi:FimV-like protein
MHLAKALIASGEKESAKRELEAIVRLQAAPLKAEAQRLLATL